MAHRSFESGANAARYYGFSNVVQHEAGGQKE
jgi:hypothetical protein